MPNSATTARMTRTMIRPIRLTPACRVFITRSPLFECAEAAELAEVEPDEERPADDVLVGDEAPDPAVARVVAVVAHHEVVARRHGARHAARIVVAIAGERKSAVGADAGGRVLVLQDFVLDAA